MSASTSSNRVRKTRSRPRVSGKANKYRSMVMGALLIAIGFGSVLYTFDYKPDYNSIVSLSGWKDWMSLWPFVLVLLGFAFVIYDYIKHSSKKKYK
jgi:hypothetical protein